jgi:hypothetical protein
MNLRDSHSRHCEERSDEAIHLSACRAVNCFAALAMTEEISTGVIPGRAQARTRNLAQ